MNNHQSDMQLCDRLGRVFKPWAIIEGKELVSYPWPERGGFYINARTIPGDPTSMKKFKIWGGVLMEVVR